MDWYPVFWNLRGHPVLVVGGGRVAARKVAALLRAGATVSVAAEGVCGQLRDAYEAGRIAYLAGAYVAEVLRGQRLVIAATDDPSINHRIAWDARDAGIPVNVVDDPEHCDFILPAVVDRSPLLIAISSGGRAPMLVRHLKTYLEARLPRALANLTEQMGRLRGCVKARLPTPAARRAFWEHVLGGSELVQIDAQRMRDVRRNLVRHAEAPDTASGPPLVALVGAGPGDPDLLTLKALQLIQGCDVVLHDALVSASILALVRPEAERVFVGKRAGGVHTPQAEIERRMIAYARRGLRVVRLKGGDPMIFGRGGEEMQALEQAGIPFEVVPGISAANGCAAYAGIPLTHRRHAHTLVMTSGCIHPDGSEHDWSVLARRRQTLVFYMPLRELDLICKQLVAHGLPSDWPAMLIFEGTAPAQRVLRGTLMSLPRLATADGMVSPAVLVVGEVTALADRLDEDGTPSPITGDARERRDTVYALL
ncbi:uroporphyrinogen-III C-methyltransferase [Acidihalobacter yilgarnensis]|uniref:Uroporphyrinogen-III C-methyltransferase n=1 Tax=Acidihalobacter yilgarnensis TaxID=2819280 RepID=A0A1D8ILV6_9GAMM|nr:siroheme synthase CysG [Acidihalobacter yilgarnensis]AOU97445.1 uroporphyrinogen-III C-methyltransferase [Acidihalobacter yilgarnensis]